MLDQWEQRIAGILGVEMIEGDDDEHDLPFVSYEMLRLYREYLRRKLTFPFDAVYDHETGQPNSMTSRITVVGLQEDADEFYGVLCEGKEGRSNMVVPLADLIVGESDPNFVFIDDYLTWFWNYR